MNERERYERLEEIGRTAASVVYRARDREDGRPVALKRYVSSARVSLDDDGWETCIEDSERCFLGPPSSVGRLEHPAIASYLRCGHDGRDFFVISELVEGEPLSVVARREQLSYRDRLELCLALADGLACAHERGVRHLALKPSNVLFGPQGGRILDFVRLGPGLQEEASTPVPMAELAHYSTPEQVRGRPLGTETDVFAFGILTYELLTGKRPFDGQSWIEVSGKILEEEPPLLKASSSSGHLNLPAVMVLSRALAKSPGDRFATGRELHQALAEVHDRLGLSTAAAPQKAWPAVDEVAEGVAYIDLIRGESRSRHELVRRETDIGRGGRNHINVVDKRHPRKKDDRISREHVRIVREKEGFLLIDRGSTHGTWLNMARVKTARLADGDEVELGRGSGCSFIFQTRLPSRRAAAPETPTGLTRRDLDLLLTACRAVVSSRSLTEILNAVLKAALDLAHAKRGVIVLRDDEWHLSTPVRVHADGSGPLSLEDEFSRSVIDECLTTGNPRFIDNTAEDSSLPDSVQKLALEYVSCVPMRSADRVLGAFYLDSHVHRGRPRSVEKELLEIFATNAAVSLESKLARLDPLTGLGNRRHYDERLGDETRRCVRYGSPLSLILIDGDEFGQVNKKYNLSIGDAVLRSVGRAIASERRETDHACRWGGDEFAIIAPETPLEEAGALAERIRRRVEEQTLVVENPATRKEEILRVTVSCAVGDSREAVESAVNEAKQGGGNRVCMASS